ncbi:PREDICTED: serine/threonine-protein kinase Nek4-like [Tarenaya hassleriana]|uniref:serine/threonine-protein kinase Nek4-like n=1 Tax=Tarenaya hassleriana TaxID=28532 RepID=UPI00053C30F8|nr:PREDICTED: serine/threonine-protein kinase Nek4-like [Tarenaya hassleriana]
MMLFDRDPTEFALGNSFHARSNSMLDWATAIWPKLIIERHTQKLCKWLVQLLMALDYLHSNHILHRDVKCSNIFLTKDQDIRLGDFGLAKVLTSDDLTSSIVGTPSYMCPELLADIPYGSKSDIWSLGCCMYEMAAHKPAFRASDVQTLVSKINKSMMDPIPAMYSGAFRGLLKSMLRKNPELRPSAAVLLNHPHLQPYISMIHLKLHSPRRSTFPLQWPDTAIGVNRRRRSFSNDTHLKPTFSETETRSGSSSEITSHSPISHARKASQITVGTVHEESVADKPAVKDRTPRVNSATTKASGTPRKLEIPLSTPRTVLKHELVKVSNTPSRKSWHNRRRRASLPLVTEPTYESSLTRLCGLNSPDVSVNAPRIDKMAEFPEDLFPINEITPRQQASSPPTDRSITEDKCMVQIRSSSEPRQRRFDTSSYQQRAEALEGLLEFSARLLQQERYEELGVLLKPFGPERVSPRETAIWLTKSFKEAAV